MGLFFCCRLWLLLCLVVVAFPPGKSFFRYFVSFLRRQLSGTPADQASRQYIEWCLDNCNHLHTAVRYFYVIIAVMTDADA